MKRNPFVLIALSLFALFAIVVEFSEPASATSPCITTVSMPYCLGTEPTVRMESDVPTVLTPLGDWLPMSPVTIIGGTGTSSTAVPAAESSYMRAVNCETSSQELCVKKIVINGVTARLVPGYTGSCIGMFATKYTLTGPAMGCSKSADLNGKVQLPDYFVYFSNRKSSCRVETQVLKCVNQQVDILPNPSLKNVPRITQLSLDLQLPTSAFETQMGIAGSNGRITSFVPSIQNGNVMHIEVSNPTRKYADYTGASTSGRCGWWSPTIESCSLASSTTDISYDPKFFFYPAPLKNTQMTNDGVVEPNPNGIGAYFSTNAQHIGLSSVDFKTGAYGVTVAGPHESHLGGLNEAFFENYWPAAYLMDNFGITPEQANASTLPVSRTLSKASSALPTTYQATATGLILSSEGITFSTPTVSTRRILLASTTRMVRQLDIIAAAGLKSVKKPGQISISSAKKDRGSIIISKSGVRFTKRGAFDLSLIFKDSNGKNATRIVRVSVK
jgi:hypothetical protein